MNPFKRQPAVVDEPEQIFGSEALRRLLKARTSRPGVAQATIARDVNDNLVTEANRKTAREIAERMPGEGASEEVIRDLAKGLMHTLPSKPVGSSVIRYQHSGSLG